MEGKLISIKETAIQLGVSINTLYSWVYLRKIEYVKIGRLLKFKQGVIDEFITGHTVPLRERKKRLF
ncbi:MAG: hypothetical protein A3G33_08215 [Omnitrophica bacterium RIFCSPLOWO2_12_FULL_44_17]|uniref:Helix-turn-helix domain-containing protein n=1 Tax=Candidatus Danuiimicrobium aquiferis TaxID=1801832 RepID=A0A1G1KX30_9BACT|nr:MAG: hypothetical protein A3B72_03430 [Omnitrophica bacterium RIFCSPHIGHO2_02_FULL_45_28]OGW92607.1 MAG: hypothetical protein A3E74_02460 [Omnitrophica bacterium RIFCSPHIGHO2_12_FULL_44_12]OGW97149.1 MAG: hypothetical protein A3G33_08215 [Omnitrophica bacterium RIFCSPLOWO2_12_FULL_44_17]OGX02209.1 MAG: hypothetical protein A3J12_07990 [Omnitrophica bacterium RIFCSPLOWO2_02_FULL_44_11]